MKKINFFLSFVICLVFMLVLVVLQFSMFAHSKLYNTDFYLSKFETMGLYDYVQSSIEKDAQNMSHITNLPSNLFSNLVTKEWIKNQFVSGVKQDIDYMLYKNKKIAVVQPKTQAESFNKNLDAYISSKNLKHDSSVDKEISKVKKDIYSIMQNETTFLGLHNFNDLSAFQKLRKFLYTLYSYQTVIFISVIVLVLLLLLVCVKDIFKFFNWLGCVIISGGLFTFIPSFIAYETKFMDNMAIDMKTIKLIAASIIRDYLVFFIKLGGVMAIAGLIMLLLSIYSEKTIYKARRQ